MRSARLTASQTLCPTRMYGVRSVASMLPPDGSDALRVKPTGTSLSSGTGPGTANQARMRYQRSFGPSSPGACLDA